MDQMRTAPSAEAETSARASGAKATATTRAQWRGVMAVRSPDS